MQKSRVFYLAIAALFNSALVFAQYTDDQKQGDRAAAPTGMEVKRVNNDVAVLVPKGTQMHQTNSTTYTMESADEYAARNFENLDNRIKKLEEENQVLIDGLKYLESKLILQEKGADKNVSKPAEE